MTTRLVISTSRVPMLVGMVVLGLVLKTDAAGQQVAPEQPAATAAAQPGIDAVIRHADAASSTVTVETRDGVQRTCSVDADTEVTVGGPRSTLAELREGQQVEIVCDAQERARTIRVRNTGALHCALGGDETRRFMLAFNSERVTGATHAVMLGLTDVPGRFRPPYGTVAFAETSSGISVEFKNTVPVDFAIAELIDDCYADAGGRYMFHDLQRAGRRFRGRFMIQSNFVRHPDRTCDVPDVTLTPEVPVMCEWVDLGLSR